MSNRNIRLSLFSGTNFTGRRILLRRGGVAVRDLGAFRFDNVLSSFRLRDEVFGGVVTLVLFAGTNFQGSFRVYRGNRNVANLANVNFNNVASSLILVGRFLSTAEINLIRSTGTPPRDTLIIQQ